MSGPARREFWPRYHQFDAGHRSLADAGAHGRRYLIPAFGGPRQEQLHRRAAYQLIGFTRDDALSEVGQVGEAVTCEDRIKRVMESHEILPNASINPKYTASGLS